MGGHSWRAPGTRFKRDLGGLSGVSTSRGLLHPTIATAYSVSSWAPQGLSPRGQPLASNPPTCRCSQPLCLPSPEWALSPAWRQPGRGAWDSPAAARGRGGSGDPAGLPPPQMQAPFPLQLTPHGLLPACPSPPTPPRSSAFRPGLSVPIPARVLPRTHVQTPHTIHTHSCARTPHHHTHSPSTPHPPTLLCTHHAHTPHTNPTPYTHSQHLHHAYARTRTHTTHSQPTHRSKRKPDSSQHVPKTQHCTKGDLQRKCPLRRRISLLGEGTDHQLWSRLVSGVAGKGVPAEGTVCVGALRPTQNSLDALGGSSNWALMLWAIPNEVCPGNWGTRGRAGRLLTELSSSPAE